MRIRDPYVAMLVLTSLAVLAALALYVASRVAPVGVFEKAANFALGLLIFSILPYVILSASSFKSYATRRLRFHLIVPPFLYCGSIAVIFTILFSGHKETAELRQYVENANAIMAPFINRIHTLTFNEDASGEKLRWPPILMRCNLDAAHKPNMRSCELQPHWVDIVFRDALLNNHVSQLPTFEPKSAILVASRTEQTGRQIRLDNGSVPEFRHVVVIYAMELNTNRIIWRSPEIWGRPASAPVRLPGVRYYSGVYGDPVDDKLVDEAILTAVPWER